MVREMELVPVVVLLDEEDETLNSGEPMGWAPVSEDRRYKHDNKAISL